MPCAIKNFSYDLTFYASIHLPTCLFSGNVRRYEDWEAEIHAVDLIAYGGEIFDLLLSGSIRKHEGLGVGS